MLKRISKLCVCESSVCAVLGVRVLTIAYQLPDRASALAGSMAEEAYQLPDSIRSQFEGFRVQIEPLLASVAQKVPVPNPIPDP